MAAAGDSEEVSSSSGTKRSMPVVIAIAGLLVSLIAAGIGFVVPRFIVDREQSDTAAVLQRVEDFAITYNTYEVAQKDDYQKRMKSLLTKEYYQEFVKITDAVFSALENNGQRSGDARILATGLDSIDADSAVALVAVNASVTNARDGEPAERRFRWRITLTRQDDKWLVSQFESVTPMDAEVDDSGLPGAENPQPEEEGK